MSASESGPQLLPAKIPLIWSVALGVAFGLFFRLYAQALTFDGRPTPPGSLMPVQATALMTLTFLVAGPLVIGYITISTAQNSASRGVATWIFLPWPAILIVCMIVYLLNLEGLICVVLYLPGALLLSSIGGVAAGLFYRWRRGRRGRRALLTCVAVFPLLIAPLENRIHSPVQDRIVETQILIHAPAATVWANIDRVRPIAPTELRSNWTHAIGFPRPIEATLSHEGIGGVRHASFEGGLLFIETVNRWEPNQLLAFSIKADTSNIPPTTLDEHVTIGGRYFDVMQGEYRLEPLPNGDIRLHLSSQERLSTDFNGYAGLWTDAIMSSLQTSILEVVKRRCEAVPARAG